MRITRNHVAREAGVSATTVSFILNGKTEAYNPKTVKKVRETAKRLGYTPNNIAKALKTGRSNIITVWVYDLTDNKNAHIIQTIFKILYNRNISILLKDTKYMTEFKEEMSSDGIICINSEEYKKKYHNVAFYSLPIVFVGKEGEFVIEKNTDLNDLCNKATDTLLNKIKEKMETK